ncbi:hypothetical protein BDY19DRAFT_996349 [Irpex rosettiformis]|uniref:Uncharacterized protein n=1 Tax=Irpex rosettiformis TaxID=378272 RepID=A0ACB8TVF3_9APHY|nr:hypothetical protein BDY19DRAFT_996349 [Irpex rosettiformis]
MSEPNTFPSVSQSDIVKSSRFWKEDGDFVLVAKNEAFKVHYDRISTPKIRGLPYDITLEPSFGQRVARLPSEVDPADFTIFLEHLYREIDETQLTESASLDRLCALIRVSSDGQLQDPDVYASARSDLEQSLKPDAIGSLEENYIGNAEDILSVVLHYDITSLRKRLLYTVSTTSHFDSGPSSHPSLSTSTTTLLASLQDNLISHFTPILFTVATASHMACTDVFAEKWMPLVIGPALETSGLCRPVETLRGIQEIEWEKEGVCEECCKEKREEWEGEIRVIWEKVDGWI